MPIHCLKCKRKTDDKGTDTITNKKGRQMETAECGVCGRKKFKFLPKLSSKA